MKAMSLADGLLGTYQKPTQIGLCVGHRAERGRCCSSLGPLHRPPKDLEALRKTRDGALITADIGRKYGWHVGDRIPLTTNTLKADGSGTWTFQIVGTFTDHETGESVSSSSTTLTSMKRGR